MKNIDVKQLPKHIDGKTNEAKWSRFWHENSVYRYKQNNEGQSFRIDSPPPTVSGSLHVGHVFSYTQTDIIARYMRMKGRSVFYPMGWDDNGLPTERRVQNVYHISCDEHGESLEGEILQIANAKQRKKPMRKLDRPSFVRHCEHLTAEDEEQFKALWTRLGLSVDWNLEYSTIGEKARKAAQYSFLDLMQKGHVYSKEAPMMWDTEFQTAVAQAEIEDREEPGTYSTIAFTLLGTELKLQIATTRPEMLPACVALAAHPGDSRYQALFGKEASTPLFSMPVPIIASEDADPEQGTGLMMICTFGDSADVEKWKTHRLPLRQIIGPDGRIRIPEFGSELWNSLDAQQANTYAGKLQGKAIRSAREIIVSLLKEDGCLIEEKQINHAVKYYEKGKKPIEFISTRQWFVRITDKKDRILKKSAEIEWKPEYMKQRLESWTENLAFDWCISRQRYFGVSFPLWYALDESGETCYDRVILAEADLLPVDPSRDCPPGYSEEMRGKPGGFRAETDVFDTWFTSSLTPQIALGWPAESAGLPMDIRPQSHEIIRTWAFYSIVKAMLHDDSLPWKSVLISGWILDPDRKKMSKSSGNVVTPESFIDSYTADGVRYWAGKARLGTDTALDESMMKVGLRLVTKLYNAAKFIHSLPIPKTEPIPEQGDRAQLDEAFLKRLSVLMQNYHEYMERFDYASALSEAEYFFWDSFTGSYLELVKHRAKSGDRAAIELLHRSLDIFLQLFAPFLPFISEEIWSWSHEDSVHQSRWIELEEIGGSTEFFDLAKAGLEVIFKFKSEQGLGTGAEIEKGTLILPNSAEVEDLRLVLSQAARVGELSLEEGAVVGFRV
jgi:valyl-tRNA synthetase